MCSPLYAFNFAAAAAATSAVAAANGSCDGGGAAAANGSAAAAVNVGAIGVEKGSCGGICDWAPAACDVAGPPRPSDVSRELMSGMPAAAPPLLPLNGTKGGAATRWPTRQ